VLLLAVASGCSAERDAASEIQAGQTRDEVVAAVGEPDEVDEVTLPSEPFFGPQEGLASLLPAGTRVEEWRYRSAGEVMYVWFAGGASKPREDWTVIDTAVFPADAVF
jgi:hypothetical protein